MSEEVGAEKDESKKKRTRVSESQGRRKMYEGLKDLLSLDAQMYKQTGADSVAIKKKLPKKASAPDASSKKKKAQELSEAERNDVIQYIKKHNQIAPADLHSHFGHFAVKLLDAELAYGKAKGYYLGPVDDDDGGADRAVGDDEEEDDDDDDEASRSPTSVKKHKSPSEESE